MNKYSEHELKTRTMHRVAYVLHGYWEEGRGAHTRIFDILIPDFYIEIGESKSGRGHREHVVPCVYIRNLANRMYSEGAAISDVASMLNRLLAIVHITKDEAKTLDKHLKLKTKMPDNWCPESGDIKARLKMAGIEIK
jgi:hypothetical protein